MTPVRRSTRAALAALLALLILVSVAVTPAAGQDASPTAADACVEPEASAEPLPEEALSIPEEFRTQLFDGVWGGIRDFYVDPEVKGLDWEAIGDEYALEIIATDNAYEVYDLLTEMVGLLDDPYTYFLSPEDLGDPASVDPTYGGIGALLDTSTAGADSDGLRILYVFEAGSARDAGIRPRDRIIAVNGDPCARISEIRGPEGTEVTLTVVSPGDEPRDIVVERRRIDPLILPEARRLAQDDEPSLAGRLRSARQERVVVAMRTPAASLGHERLPGRWSLIVAGRGKPAVPRWDRGPASSATRRTRPRC